MLRNRFNEALKTAMRARDVRAVSTIRLIMAALKDRDIAARGKGQTDGVDEENILSMLQTMIKQRRESIRLYEQGGRMELAERERTEIGIVERFLPSQLNDTEMQQAVAATIASTGATGIRDMGKVMAELKAAYVGRMDFSKVSGQVKACLMKN